MDGNENDESWGNLVHGKWWIGTVYGDGTTLGRYMKLVFKYLGGPWMEQVFVYFVVSRGQ